MSFNIIIAGHVADEDSDRFRAKEEAIADALRPIVATLDGVHRADASFDHIGYVNLLSDTQQAAAQAAAANAPITPPSGQGAGATP